MPDIHLSEAGFERLAMENAGKGYTVPGVQKKLPLHLVSRDKPRLTLFNYPAGYIL